ncbi:hypothetical protein [Phocaeicola sp.]
MKRRIERITTVFSGPFSKKRNGLRKSISLLLLGMMGLAASCISEEEIYPSESGGSQTDREVNFLIAVPYAAPTGTQTGTQSRAIETDQENAIDNIYVLAFKVEYEQNGTIKSETYDYSAIGIKSAANTEGASSQSFTVKVRVKDYKQRFVVITNAEDAVTALTGDPNTWTGKDKADMLANLKVSLGQTEDRWKVISASDYTAFPMWGESGAEKITGSTNSLSMAIPMLRMIAKINVQLDETVSGLTNKFKMKSVHLYNTNTSGHVVPSIAAVKEEIRNTNQRYLVVEEPTIPSDAVLSKGPIEYTDFTAPGTPDVAMKGAIYTFETKAPSNEDRMKATCLVIGGLYGDDTNETYYRVDFFESDGKTLRDILRNYQYVVNITDVKGRGHESVDVAYKSKSVNMVAETLYWNEAGLGNNVFDGQNILSVSQDSYFFSRDAKISKEEDNVLNIMTDYKTTATGGKSGWYVEKIVDANDETAEVTWVDLSQRNGAADNPAEVFLTVEENKTTTERSAIIWIAAGRLRYPVKVTQSLTPALGIQVVDGNNKPITELVFAGVNPAQQIFTINWQPKDADLTVINAQVGTEAFPSNSGAPTSGMVPAGHSGTGTITYIITPQAFTAAEVDEQTGNPFLEKVSKIDFTTTNGISFANASIFLRQINYNLVVSGTTGYILDGSTYSFNVKSNAAWRIKSITEDPSDGKTQMLQFQPGDNMIEGETGGYDTANGETITFSVITDPTQSISGTIDVVFESQDGLFSEVTVPLNIVNSMWARSNIVFVPSDDLEKYPEGGYLTFAVTPADNATIPANSQGVFFKWGSLVAISPTGGNTIYMAGQLPNGHIVFSPTKKYNYAYTSIPYISETYAPFNDYGGGDDFATYNGNTGFNVTSGKGDICRYISAQGWVHGNWRLPTADEFNQLRNEPNVRNGDFNNIVLAPNNAYSGYGRYVPLSGYWCGTSTASSASNPSAGIYFPACGMRTTAGDAANCGMQGNYQSASSWGPTSEYTMAMLKDRISYWSSVNTRECSAAVRCIRERE